MKAFAAIMMLIILSMPASAYSVLNTKMHGSEVAADGDIIAFVTYEGDARKDLNGDNDTADRVIQYYDISADKIRNTGREGRNPSVHGDLIVFEDKARRILIYDTGNRELTDTKSRGTKPTIYGKRIGFATSEKDEGDLNGDNDDSDTIMQYYDIGSGTTTSTDEIGENALMLKDHLVFETDESKAGEDLNRDGDRDDKILRYYDFENDETVNTRTAGTRPSGFRQSPIAILDGEIRLLDLAARKEKNTGVAGDDFSLYGNLLAVARGKNLFARNIEQGNEKQLNITGTEPTAFDSMIAFVTEDREVALLTGDDDDKDSVPDFADNCPGAANYEQADADNDSIGDACDTAEPVINTTAPEPAQNTTIPGPTANTVAQPQTAAAAPAPQAEPVSAEPAAAPLPERRDLPETTMLDREKPREKSAAYWFLVAVGITMIGVLIYVAVPRWMRKRRKSFGF